MKMPLELVVAMCSGAALLWVLAVRPRPPSGKRRSAGLVDSYAAVNWRPGPTWSPLRFIPAMARIDYVFVPEELTIAGSCTIHLPGSDHRGVITDIALN